MLLHLLHQVDGLLLQLLDSTADLLRPVVHERVVYFERVVSSPQTYYPVLVIHDIIVVGIDVFVERKLQSLRTEGLIELFFVTDEEQRASRAIQQQLGKVNCDRIHFLEVVLGPVLWGDPGGAQKGSINVNPYSVFVAELHDLLVDVDGSAESGAVACAEPEGDEPIADVFLNDGLELLHVYLVIEPLLVVDVGCCSPVIHVLDGEGPFRTNVASLPVVPNKLQHVGIVACDVQFFQLPALGSVHSHEDGLSRGIVYDSAPTVFEEEFRWQT